MITLEWLQAQKACIPAQEEFQRRWPDGQCTIGQSVDALEELDRGTWADWLLYQLLLQQPVRLAAEIADADADADARIARAARIARVTYLRAIDAASNPGANAAVAKWAIWRQAFADLEART